jgi:hypothetical protein
VTVHAWTLVFLRVGIWLIATGLLGVLVWAGWDLVLIGRGELAGNSISQAAMRALYAAHPGVLIAITLAVGLLVGILLGHFGWAQTRSP